MTRPTTVFVADDFTGASDTLATLARAGMRTRLYTRFPESMPDDLDAIGIATELRAMSPEEGRAAVEELAPKVAALDARIIHLKVCSTFDSSPETGNICTVADVLAKAIGADLTTLVGGQPSLGRFCLFGTLFAAASDGAVYRIDRHPVMKNHPITPMAEADLRRHLARQGWNDIDLVDYRSYADGPAALCGTLSCRVTAGRRRVLLDVSSGAALATIGQALWDLSGRHRVLCVGASSVAEAILPFAGTPTVAASKPPLQRDGPVLVISGSRSSTTKEQIDAARAYEKLIVPASDFLPGSDTGLALAQRCGALLQTGSNVLVAVASGKHGSLAGRRLSHAIAQFTSDLIKRARPGCLVVAGGDTSSAIVSTLNVESLEFMQDIDRGVSLIRVKSSGPADGIRLALKGGQMGARNMFDALAVD